jgi:hypothetical protein
MFKSLALGSALVVGTATGALAHSVHVGGSMRSYDRGFDRGYAQGYARGYARGSSYAYTPGSVYYGTDYYTPGSVSYGADYYTPGSVSYGADYYTPGYYGTWGNGWGYSGFGANTCACGY